MKKRMGKLLVLTVVLVLLVVLKKLWFSNTHELTLNQKMQQVHYYKNIDGLSPVHSFFVGSNREFLVLVQNSQGALDYIEYRDPNGKLGKVVASTNDITSGGILEQAKVVWNNTVCQDNSIMKLIDCKILDQKFVPYNTKLGTCNQGLSQCVALKIVELSKNQKSNQSRVRIQGFVHNSTTLSKITQGTMLVTQPGKQTKTIESYRSNDASFVTTLASTGTYKITLNAQGYTTTIYHLVLTEKDLKVYNDDNQQIFSKDVSSEAVELLMDLEMIPHAVIAQNIVDKDTKEPINGAIISLVGDSKQVANSKTNAKGLFILIPVPTSGATDLKRQVVAEGYQTQEGIWSLNYDVQEGTNKYVVKGLEQIEMSPVVEDDSE